MDEFDKTVKTLETGAALPTQSHIEHLKSKGKRGCSIWTAIQDWEARELIGDKNKLSTPTTILAEAFVLELIAK